MPETKAAYFVIQMLGWSTYFWAFIETWGDIRSLILFLLGVVFAVIKVCDKIVDFKKKRLIMTNTSEKLYEKENERKRAAMVIQIWHKSNSKIS